MGSCASTPNEIQPFANRNENGQFVLEKRTPTDVVFLCLFGIFLVIWAVLLSYCFSSGDIYRILNGYDDCGRVCGRRNAFDTESSMCAGGDLTDMKYLRVLSTGVITSDSGQVHRVCVQKCSDYPGFSEFLNRCLPDKSERQANTFFSKTGISEFFQEVSEDLNTCSDEIIYLMMIAFASSVVIILLFKYAAKFIVWIVLIGVVVVCTAGTILLWQQYAVQVRTSPESIIDERRRRILLGFSILSTIVTVVICLLIFALRKRIRLVIQLFKEAGRVATSMPLLLFEPLLTFLCLAAVIFLWLYFSIWIESAGALTVENNKSAKYVKDDTIKATRWYNVMAMLWCSQFIIGCQHMVVAGAVSTWFFTRDKETLKWPILVSFTRLFRYHLGTVALGSLLVASVQFIRIALAFVESTTKNASNRFTKCLFSCCECCLAWFENCLKAINRNAYIETAIHGYPFFIAGRAAFNRLAANTLRVFAINSVGDFVLFLGKVFVVAFTVICGFQMLQTKEGVHHMWIPIVLAAIFAYLIAHSFLTIYEVTIDTIFLCFCEDYERNDGITRPYYMSSDLKEFIEQSKVENGGPAMEKAAPTETTGNA